MTQADQSAGRIQERYGVARKEAGEQTGEWSRALTESEREARGAGSGLASRVLVPLPNPHAVETLNRE